MKTDIAQFGSFIYELFTRINLSDPRHFHLEFIKDELKDTSGYFEDSDESSEEDIDEDSGEESCDEAENCGRRIEQGPKWPRAQDLPSTDHIPFGAIIRQCWFKGYQNMHEVCDALSQWCDPDPI